MKKARTTLVIDELMRVRVVKMSMNWTRTEPEKDTWGKEHPHRHRMEDEDG